MGLESFPVESMRIVIDMHMNASPEQIFAALTTGVAIWWGPGYLESAKLARDLILEPRLGGRFYESWDDSSTDKDGALLGNVIQIKKLQLIKVAGYFGLEEHCAFGVVSIWLKRQDGGTLVKFQHDATGDLDEAIKETQMITWQNLLDALRTQVEHHQSLGVRSDPAFED
jgi:uncharacterized protein YndB with AHSA1/START domain